MTTQGDGLNQLLEVTSVVFWIYINAVLNPLIMQHHLFVYSLLKYDGCEENLAKDASDVSKVETLKHSFHV